MRPFHFGDRRQPLFGVLHEPSTTPRPTAILICAPWGMEYLRAYRALGQLATLLAARGFPALRFDYRGTGDSAGDGRTASLADWIADTRLAAQTLRAAHEGGGQLVLIGLRFGAMLAQQAVVEGVAADALVLWDAPPSGEVYVENLQHLDRTLADARNLYRSPRAQLPPAESDELLGHCWPAPLAQAVSALPGLRDDLALPLHVFVSRDRTPAEGVESQRLPDAGHWSDGDRLAARWMPTASLAAIADHLGTALA